MELDIHLEVFGLKHQTYFFFNLKGRGLGILGRIYMEEIKDFQIFFGIHVM